MMVASQLSNMGERLMPPNRSAMNSRLLKQMVSPRGKTSLDRRSLVIEVMNADDGTIETSRGKARFKSPYLACQLSAFLAPARNRVVKIARSSSDMVLQTIEHTMIYPGSGPSSEVIAL
jgi:hypothetical protein